MLLVWAVQDFRSRSISGALFWVGIAGDALGLWLNFASVVAFWPLIVVRVLLMLPLLLFLDRKHFLAGGDIVALIVIIFAPGLFSFSLCLVFSGLIFLVHKQFDRKLDAEKLPYVTYLGAGFALALVATLA